MDLRLTAMDIYHKLDEFRKTFRGFDPNEVESYLEVVARAFEEINRENEILKNRIANMEEQIDEYRKKEESVHLALLRLQKFVEDTEDAAKKETELRIREAKIQAEQIVREAQEKANKIREDTLRLQSEKEKFIAEYRAFLHTQLKLISEIDTEDIEYYEETEEPFDTSSEAERRNGVSQITVEKAQLPGPD